MLGLLKLFSLVSMYNQAKFENHLHETLTSDSLYHEEIDSQQRIKSFDVDVGALNKSTDDRLLIEKSNP